MPLPGRAIPIASIRQFIEFAVNIPAHEPQVGQAARSISRAVSSLTFGFAPATMESIMSICFSTPSTTIFADSMGPPLTNIVGMLRRIAAIIIPGVILSQFEMQIKASAQWAFTMYSTLSAISSRDGRE